MPPSNAGTLDNYSDVQPSIATSHSLATLKERVHEKMKTRLALGPPAPTDKHPYPPADLKCNCCRR
eukprot:3418771-Pyramimonas_sp.AAC.1